ncbi:MAG: MoxR family ATPase [Elusimicrobia bacterium]|nr:MoxR family ATPase [Elusimicrobiota bacterium]
MGGVVVNESSRIDDFIASVSRVRAELRKAIVGQEAVVEQLLIGLFSRGHILLVGVPGLAKTLLVSSMARVLDLTFQRIQFTPDLMPSDITGTDVLQEDLATRQRTFQFAPGPVFTHLLLADEINRTPPKTQAALLQAMQERAVTVLGKTFPLPDPFFVMATQNPIEQEGTYPLPEAQLDRFLFQINMDYPSEAEERQILMDTTGPVRPDLNPVLSAEKIVEFQDLIRRVPVAPSVVEKTLRLVRQTRPQSFDAEESPRSMLAWGAGPRAGQALLLGAKVRCLINGRFTVSWDDVAALAAPVLRHRLIVSFRGQAEGRRPDELIQQFLKEGS